MALSNTIATLGQYLGLPEYKISERISGTTNQTVPSYTGGGLFGSGGYVRSPVPGGTSVYDISGGKFTEGPYKGQDATGQILGASSGSSSAGGGGGGGSWGGNSGSQQQVPSDFGGGGSGSDVNRGGYTWSSQADYDSDTAQARALGFASAEAMREAQINELNNVYSGALGVLADTENQVRSGYTEDELLLNQGVDRDIEKYNQEQANMLQDYTDDQNAYNKTLDTALQQAVKAYNALQQQAKSRFGFGSSAGQAVGELAQQEFFRQQGNVNEKRATGALEFQKEMDRAKQYVRTKIDDLEQYRREATSALKKNMQDRLNEIAARRGDIESNKALDKMNVMRETQQRLQYLADQDRQFRQGLAMAAISSMQEVAGRSFTPQEIKATLSEFGAGLPDLSYSTPVPQYNTAYRPRNNDDELKSLYI